MYRRELYHHGIMGQKWGIRRFQNPDGTLTRKGKERYSKDAKIIKNSESNKHLKFKERMELIQKTDIYKDSVNKTKEKLADDLNENKELNIRSKELVKDYNKNPEYYLGLEAMAEAFTENNKRSKSFEDIHYNLWNSINDDGDEGQAMATYLRNNGTLKEAYSINRRSDEINEKIHEEIRDTASKLLENNDLKVANEREVNGYKFAAQYVSDKIKFASEWDSIMDYSAYSETHWASNPTPEMLSSEEGYKRAIDFANRANITVKQNHSNFVGNGDDGWNKVNIALEKLGYYDNDIGSLKDASKMTQSDWDDIADYIREKL